MQRKSTPDRNAKSTSPRALEFLWRRGQDMYDKYRASSVTRTWLLALWVYEAHHAHGIPYAEMARRFEPERKSGRGFFSDLGLAVAFLRKHRPKEFAGLEQHRVSPDFPDAETVARLSRLLRWVVKECRKLATVSDDDPEGPARARSRNELKAEYARIANEIFGPAKRKRRILDASALILREVKDGARARAPVEKPLVRRLALGPDRDPDRLQQLIEAWLEMDPGTFFDVLANAILACLPDTRPVKQFLQLWKSIEFRCRHVLWLRSKSKRALPEPDDCAVEVYRAAGLQDTKHLPR